MKKSIDLNTLKRRYVRKEPTYTPREQLALDNADRVVARVLLSGKWAEKDFFPDPGTTVRQCLETVQAQLRHSPSLKGVCLYVGAEVNGERMIAAMPHDWVPANLKR